MLRARYEMFKNGAPESEWAKDLTTAQYNYLCLYIPKEARQNKKKRENSEEISSPEIKRQKIF